MADIKCELIDYMGSDNRVVDAARVSMNKTHERYTEEQNAKLIKYLATHNHWTPASHCMITVRETVPIFVARQRFKHTVGFTYNELSRRYVDDPPEFYVPDAWRKRAENVKQGSSDETVNLQEHLAFEDGDWNSYNDYSLDEFEAEMRERSILLYNSMLRARIAPEQARMILPQSMMTSYYCTGSLAAFARAYNLRSDDHAQKEIRDLADQWNEIIGKLFPVSWGALTNV